MVPPIPNKPALIISDEPKIVSGQDREKAKDFGFDGYAKTIADLIANKENSTPLVIGIYGPWGSGKTTLMKTIESRLREYKRDETFRVCKPVWFQAWKYAEEEAILDACLHELSPDHLEVIVLRDFAGGSWEWIAKELHRSSEGAARELHHRAVIALGRKASPRLPH